MPYKKDILNQLNLNVLDMTPFVGDVSWQHNRIVSPFNRFYWVMEGEGVVRHAGGEVRLQPGHAYLIPAGLKCDYRCPRRLEKFYAHANVRLLGHEDLFHGAMAVLENPFPLERMKQMVSLWHTGTPASLLQLKAMLLEAAALFLEQVGTVPVEETERRNRYAPLLREVAGNPALATPESLAALIGLSLPVLLRAFRRDMGVTLRQYIRDSLLEQVKIRLQTSDTSVRNISLEAGFEDEFYFSRMFRRHVGVSPSEYRMQNRMI